MLGRNAPIIVLGASAGGTEALMEIASKLPAGFRASIFIVLHVPDGIDHLAPVLDFFGPLPAETAQDGAMIQAGHIYVARSDRHLLLEPGRMRLSAGPREKWNRPAINPLFRSAAQVYGPRVIGVILTGLLDDGAAGLRTVKSHGGIAVVQDPADARYPGMPRNAMRAVTVDACLPLEQIPSKLVDLAGRCCAVSDPLVISRIY